MAHDWHFLHFCIPLCAHLDVGGSLAGGSYVHDSASCESRTRLIAHLFLSFVLEFFLVPLFDLEKWILVKRQKSPDRAGLAQTDLSAKHPSQMELENCMRVR